MVGVVGERHLEPLDAGEQLAVARRRGLAKREDRVELLDLAEPERGPDVVDPVVEAEAGVVEPAAAVGAALVAQADERAPGLLVVRRHDPALAGRHLLVRIEGEDGVDAVRADGAALVLGAERLARVLDQDEAVLLGERAERVELARVAEDVDGDDPLRPRRDRRLDRGRIEVHRPLVDVGEHRRRTLVDEAVGRGDERVRRRDHLVALAQATDRGEQVQPARARRDGGRVGRADLLREGTLEALDRRAERQPARPEHLEDELLVPLVHVRGRERDALRVGSHASAAVCPTATRSSQWPQRSLLPRTVSR